MYIRMGPTREKEYVQLDDVVIYSRDAMDKYIHQIEAIRDAAWPPEETEPEQVS
jgi:hypothetical protein